MSWIRDEDEAWLVELHAQGAELVERYRELLQDAVPPPAMAEALAKVVDAREACLDRLADRLRARDALPSAGDPDRAFVQALADALGGSAATLSERLRAAESRWRNTLDGALDLAVEQDWDDADADVLEALANHMDDSIERLGAIAG